MQIATKGRFELYKRYLERTLVALEVENSNKKFILIREIVSAAEKLKVEMEIKCK